MTINRTRTGIRLAALAACSGLLLAACSSSEPAATPSPSVSAIASTSAEPSTSASATGAPTAAALACSAYFEMDLLNSAYAGGAVKDGDMTEEQVRADFKRLLKEMVVQAKLAFADGTADQKMAINALKMKKLVKSLPKNASLSDLSKAQQTKFAKQSLRVQNACNRAGLPLPDDNITARTSAGLQ